SVALDGDISLGGSPGRRRTSLSAALLESNGQVERWEWKYHGFSVSCGLVVVMYFWSLVFMWSWSLVSRSFFLVLL
ncbi:hypothetical protein HID58_058151, partial [Brassica napus]